MNSHPATLLRHEPDTIVRGGYPFVSDEIYEQEALDHVSRLVNVTNIKSAGTRPVFRKDYHSTLQHLYREALIYSAKGLGRVVESAARMQVPDLVDVRDTRVVIKSVSALGRTKSIAGAFPDAPFIFIIRHPCGHVESVLRGRSSGLLPDDIPLGFCELEAAKKYGLSSDQLELCEPAVRLAWKWAVLNEKVLTDIPGAKVVIYENLCLNPIEIAKDLFESLDLKWSQQTEEFILASTKSEGSYFETSRNPLVAANRWRDNFKSVDAVLEMLEPTRAFQFYQSHVLCASDPGREK